MIYLLFSATEQSIATAIDSVVSCNQNPIVNNPNISYTLPLSADTADFVAPINNYSLVTR